MEGQAMKRTIVISIHGTTRCDTGCSHCSFNSCSEGYDLPLEAVIRLKQSIRSYRGKVEVAFTGGGESLKWQGLPEAISILKDSRQVSFGLVTSGCKDEKDDRYAVLNEAFKVENLIQVFHSFNLFSPSFPERLAFTLPVVLRKSRYNYTGIKLVSGFSPEDNEENEARFYFTEVTAAFEQALEQGIGRCARLAGFPARGHYDPKILKSVLKRRRVGGQVENYLTYKSFLYGMTYLPYATEFSDRVIQTIGATVMLRGRFKKFLTPGLADYAYGIGFYCDGYGDILTLSAKGELVFCPYRTDFPPLFLGEVGGSLGKAILTKRRLTYEWLNLPRLELTSKGSFDPCDNCVTHAWEVFNKRGYDYLE